MHTPNFIRRTTGADAPAEIYLQFSNLVPAALSPYHHGQAQPSGTANDVHMAASALTLPRSHMGMPTTPQVASHHKNGNSDATIPPMIGSLHGHVSNSYIS